MVVAGVKSPGGLSSRSTGDMADELSDHRPMQSLYNRALAFAQAAHAGQVRKFTGEPYIVHPVSVAALLRGRGCDDELVAAGLLHDTIEDCPGISAETLKAEFGERVASLVVEVTKVSTASDGNRAARIARDRAHLATISRDGMTLKLADIIDNTGTVAVRDPAFARSYLAEKRALLPVLRGGDARLWTRADEICRHGG